MVLLAVAAYARWLAVPTELGRIRGDGLATLLYVANWHDIVGGRVYGDQFVAPSPLLHTWSLAIEEQFYLVWPIVVLAVLRWRRRRIDVFAIALFVAFAGVVLGVGSFVAGVEPDPTLYEGTHTRIAAIAMGAALAA